MTILRKASQIADASTADLIETYNAMAGKNIKKFSSRAAGERQVEMALLAASDATAHRGVPPNTKTVAPKTVAELGAPSPAAPAPKAHDVATSPAANPFPVGSMAHGLLVAANAAKKVAAKSAPSRTKMGAVRLSPTPPTAKLQSASQRKIVFDKLIALAEAEGEGPVAVERLEKELEGHVVGAVRGHLQKLLVTNHIVRAEAE